jgi:hypothetical protein
MVTRNELAECAPCLQESMTPFLAEACASVGIEHGKTTEEMLVAYLAQFHENGHLGGNRERIVRAYGNAAQARRQRRS